MFESDNDLLNIKEITGGEVGSVSASQRSFKPWHKPRKQYIRDRQWWSCFQNMLKENIKDYEDVDVIKYFGLPGGDLLDVEFIRNRLHLEDSFKKKNLLVHGFISNQADKESAEARMSMFLDEYNVHKSSMIENFNFNALSSKKSLAWRNLKEKGPYDIVNLDFCDCIFKADTIDAVFAIINFQIKAHNRDRSWLLCLTTRVDRPGVSSSLYEKLSHALGSIAEMESLLRSLKGYYADALRTIESRIRISEIDPSDFIFSELMQILVVYWVVSNALHNESKVKLVSSMKYKVDPSSEFEDMFSFVFKLTGVDSISIDALGFASNSAEHSITETEKFEIRSRALLKLARSTNIDYKLENDSDLKMKYALSMKELLDRCGWNTTGYFSQVCPEIVQYPQEELINSCTTESNMNNDTNKPELPNHLSINPRSPHFVEECFEHDIGIRFKGKERTDIEEYNISEGWVKISSPTTKDRFGRPLLIKLKGEVEAFYK